MTTFIVVIDERLHIGSPSSLRLPPLGPLQGVLVFSFAHEVQKYAINIVLFITFVFNFSRRSSRASRQRENRYP